MKKLITIFFLILASFPLLCQDENIIFDELTYKDGLEPSWIYAICQDAEGFIWIGNAGGLQRYDGYEFVDYSDRVDYNLITEIYKDADGILWVSTYSDGIYLLNPENDKITHFTSDTVKRVNGVFQDDDRVIWCATYEGLIRMKPVYGQGSSPAEVIFNKGVESAFNISVFRFDSTSRSHLILDILEDRQGRFWVGGANGLFIFNKETTEFIRIDDNGKGNTRFINSHYVRAVAEESPDVYWVKTVDGFSRISNVQKAFSGSGIDKSLLEITNYNYKELVAGTGLRRFFVDSRNNLWYGALNNGLIKIKTDNNGKSVFNEVYPDIHQPGGSLFDVVTAIMEDRTGLIWTGHEKKGIRKFRLNNNPFTPLEKKLWKFNLNRYDFNQIYEDDDRNLWVCSWGSGIFKISADGEVKNYRMPGISKSDTMGNYTTRLIEIEKGTFWIGGYDGIWQLDVKTGKSHKLFTGEEWLYITGFLKVEDLILIGSNNQGLWAYNLKTNALNKYRIDPNDSLGLKSSNINAFCLMKNGEVWLSTSSGMNRLKLIRSTGEINFMPLPDLVVANSNMVNEESRNINTIFEDHQGRIWLGTDNGLLKLDLETEEIKRWTSKEGLTSNYVLDLEEDNYGNLWLGTWHGLSMLDPLKGIVRTFDESDGLPDIVHSIGQNAYKNKEGLIYFTGTGSFYSINPDYLYRNDMAPPVVITEFRLFNKPVEADSGKHPVLTGNISYTNEIELQYNQNDIAFTFAAMDYNDPSQNRYAYMLEGYQDEWIETTAADRTANYTNLSPGEYVFRVKASNNDGIWNEEGASVEIKIHPPWWRTILAYMIYFLVVALAILGYVRWRTWMLRKEKEMLEEQVNKRTIELQEANTQLEEQKEELEQQKEELLITLDQLKETQAQLIQSEKLAALGGLVAGVAHEINTPVGIGLTAASSLEEETRKMADLYKKDKISRADFKDYLNTANQTAKLILSNMQRTADMVQSFKQVSTDQSTEQRRSFLLKTYIEDVIRSLYPKLKNRKIQIGLDMNEKLELDSFPGAFSQIITNLVLNSLTHGFEEEAQGRIEISASMEKGNLNFKYSDNGKGISPAHIDKIFEPFFTTNKKIGTGLGMHIVYNLVTQKLNGNIACESEVNKGTRFKIEIPL